MSTEAQREATKRYRNKNIRQINIDFNRITDADILNWLDKQPNRSKAVKDALREAIKQTDDIEDMINQIGSIIFIDTLKKFGGEGVERFKEVFNDLFPTSNGDVKASDLCDKKRIIEKLIFIINRLVVTE